MSQHVFSFLVVRICSLNTAFVNFSKPPELQVAIQDFGPSWRDGRAFLSLIHSINPSLVQNAPEEDTNRQRLERAFSVAQHDLDIPRLLEPDG